MSAKAIREAAGKQLLSNFLPAFTTSAAADGASQVYLQNRVVSITKTTDLATLGEAHPWLLTTPLVVKPDQLIKRRGKLGLIKVNTDLAGAVQWITERRNKSFNIGAVEGTLDTFIIEPFVPHEASDEYYICILSERDGDEILFHHEGGVDIGDVDAKAVRLMVNVKEIGAQSVTPQLIREQLLQKVPAARQEFLANFIHSLYKLYVALFFTYLEINPLVVVGTQVHVLDLAAKLDQTAEFECKPYWAEKIEFPPPFGREASAEERYIAELDQKSGSSLKLTILNRKGRIWTMVAGGGASVVYSDTICDLGGAAELANYGEYSGAPSESQTYEYAKTILKCMTDERDERGKVLIIGGGIANFTNVADTFKGIVRALKEFQKLIVEHGISIYVRRGGPNYQEGLRIMRDLGETLGVPIHVYGPETHMTAIVGMALGLFESPEAAEASKQKAIQPSVTETLFADGKTHRATFTGSGRPVLHKHDDLPAIDPTFKPLFSTSTRSIIFGMQPRAVQGMLDFDHVCRRERPSVAAMVYPFSGDHTQKYYWGSKEILVPCYQRLSDAIKAHADADVVINFASFRSAYATTLEALQFHKQIRTIAIIAEGIPENRTRDLIFKGREVGVTVIGPATVGGIKPGCFRIGNTGGMLDNIMTSKLYRAGSVAYVSRSGGMSNELNNIISRTTNGVYEGVAIGGDRYPGTTFIDHLFRYQADPEVKMLVLLGEVGGTEEYDICDAIKSGKLTKPLVAWCIGTCASMFTSEVQFGHAGACANADNETAVAKNKALRDAGAIVPSSFDSLDTAIRATYDQLKQAGIIVPKPEPPVPSVPIDFAWAKELGLIRKPANFVSTISDERGEELLYAGMPISKAFQDDIGVAGVLSLLWFKRLLPDYACKFIEMCLMVTADHGPAVSGAHNTIVTARAGKDLVSSLCSGLLTIGDRFGGALDEAAQQFSEAYDAGLTPAQFVAKLRSENKLIMGVGHKVKSVTNPDMRVTIIRDFCKKTFPTTPLLNFALEVEKLTTAKKPNLILNVDGCIAVCMVDLFRHSGAFTNEEAREYLSIGTLNGLFVLGRTIGFVGHFLDQKRLKQGLYRHDWSDISTLDPTKFPASE
ncbi:ATP citrate-lyase [Capsaspora owczarzaki ATCC 30864]|uniref:ATP-citrate synthase n=1 Tax=Capsaspora owczarzaki (strain ATCC 30864) TaxID=595528 RepID=A0A0D2UGM7_CAPO3|nr:ATP citrate-lyase [Capsaspora owczarzaki ATCC 30864]KJE94236.1 ATP citrate-lyase [Capsaspora owczarzaki ATCC 30864]|eukprot:XP_004347660.1 ATP citrate-lyase [Capsaspora owczarzaki ATCC 30864]